MLGVWVAFDNKVRRWSVGLCQDGRWLEAVTGLATVELRRVETMTGGLVGKRHDWRPLSPCFVVG